METPGDTEDAEATPVISLEEVRQRRREEAEREGRARAAGVQLRRQQDAMTEAILADRTNCVEIMDMIRLGVMTDSPDRLPCEELERDEDYYRWLRLAKDLPGADEDREEAMRPRYPGEPEEHGRHRAEPPPPNRVQCPLMAAIILEETPPCIEAIRVQANNAPWIPGKGLVEKPVDPEDPIVKHEVRPCVLLGHHALVGMMRPVWLREEEDKDK